MINKILSIVKPVFILAFFLLTVIDMFPQIGRGNRDAHKVGNHDGNMVHTVFTNYGAIGQPGDQGGMAAWKYDNNGYVGDISMCVGIRLPLQDYIVNGFRDGKNDTLHSVVICPVSRSGGFDKSPDGSTDWGFEPIPGFFNPSLKAPGKGVAMSHLPETWPSFWPDQPTWIGSDGKAEWNGYFGRGQMNADQESYFWMDDNADEKMFLYHGFLPDSTDPTRKGAALRVKVRGLQWASFLAQDCIFWLYEISNIGTSVYDQTSFGIVVGTYVGGSGDEWNDDASFFNLRESITYTWDFDHYIRPSANPKWEPDPSDVGYIGYAFLESPGNPYDGIDNDGDNKTITSSAPFFTPADFEPRTVHSGDKLVLIDKNTYKRSLYTMPDYPVTVNSMGVDFYLVPDTTELVEGNILPGTAATMNPNASDGIDNDLDGLIDENYQLHYQQYKVTKEGVVLIDTINAVQYIDYVNGRGLDAKLIDESRSDGIDNDGDWDPLIDDVGADGKAGTHDVGEGDGIPTEGEPDFDSKDIDESDQIGLTSFDYFVPSTDIKMNDDEDLWERLTPGRFDVPSSIVNNKAIRGEDGDFIYGSGYFPLLPGGTERFSLALVFGDDYVSVIRNKRIVQLIYDANYNFPRPPEKPTLTAVPGDHKVTLYWDKVAESSVDMALKEVDFEGYKIYKSTDRYFSDCKTISNGYGTLVDYKPYKQFDLNNDIKGFFNQDALLYQLSSGTPFYLGDDTGIQNTFVDDDVINGKTYYYAVVAYDHGKASESIYPSENTKTITMDAAGNITTDINTAVVTPQAPVAGYTPPESGLAMDRISGASSAVPYVEVIDPTKSRDVTYELTFIDSLIQGIPVAYAYNLVNLTTGDTVLANDNKLLSSNGDIFDGMSLSINNNYQVLDSIRLDTVNSGWNTKNEQNLKYTISQFKTTGITGIRYPDDYLFVFSDTFNEQTSDLKSIIGSSSPIKSKTTNLAIYDITDRDNPVKIEYGFVDKSGAYQDTLSDFDVIYLTSRDGKNLSWRVIFQGDSLYRLPTASDTLLLQFHKPLSSKDMFRYTAVSTTSNEEEAKQNINEVKAVPNPYVVSNMYEKPLPSTLTGRGERVINFINLPPYAKIHIYSSNGSHVATLQHDGNLQSGTVSWDVRSKEGLDIAAGVYFYVVETQDGSAKKIGKLAIIK